MTSPQSPRGPGTWESDSKTHSSPAEQVLSKKGPSQQCEKGNRVASKLKTKKNGDKEKAWQWGTWLKCMRPWVPFPVLHRSNNKTQNQWSILSGRAVLSARKSKQLKGHAQLSDTMLRNEPGPHECTASLCYIQLLFMFYIPGKMGAERKIP